MHRGFELLCYFLIVLRRSSAFQNRMAPTRRSSRLSSSKRPRSSPNFSFGLIADIQYAPIPDGASYSGNPRYYEHSLTVAEHAAKYFQAEKLDLVVNLGDIIDGKCQAIESWGGKPFSNGKDAGMICFERVINALDNYNRGRMIHVYGNHCLYNLSRQTLKDRLKIPFVQEPCGELVGYYNHVHGGIRFVVLDSYDINTLKRGEKEESEKYKAACRILTENNPNFPEQENSPEGLTGINRRFVGFNGAVGPIQLEWLEQTLETSRANGEKVIVLSHQPIHPESSNSVCLIWNYKEVLSVLRKFKDVVMASFAGHAHKGGYARDRSGIHFRVVEAALETPSPGTTYAVVHTHDDHLELCGFGDCNSAIYALDHQPLPEASHID